MSDDELLEPPSKTTLGKLSLVKGRIAQIPGAHNQPVLELSIRTKIFSVSVPVPFVHTTVSWKLLQDQRVYFLVHSYF